jgi:hypothetical protein
VCYLPPTRIGAFSAAVRNNGGFSAAGCAALNGRLKVTASTSLGCCRSSSGAVGSLQGLQGGADVAGMLKHVTAELVHCVADVMCVCRAHIASTYCMSFVFYCSRNEQEHWPLQPLVSNKILQRQCSSASQCNCKHAITTIDWQQEANSSLHTSTRCLTLFEVVLQQLLLTGVYRLTGGTGGSIASTVQSDATGACAFCTTVHPCCCSIPSSSPSSSCNRDSVEVRS